jgi:hypothetical protein
MDYHPSHYPESIQPEASAKRGCFFYGCLVTLILVIVGIFALYFGGKSLFNRLINEYTGEQPLDLSQDSVDPEQYQISKEKIDAFMKNWDAGQTQDPLILTNQDINAYLSHHPHFKEVKGKVLVQMEGDKIKSWVSIPLKDLDLDSGRYINGYGEFKVFLNNQMLFIYMENMKVNDTPLPESVMVELRKENLAKDFKDDPELAQHLEKFEKIEVKDSVVILLPRTKL